MASNAWAEFDEDDDADYIQAFCDHVIDSLDDTLEPKVTENSVDHSNGELPANDARSLEERLRRNDISQTNTHNILDGTEDANDWKCFFCPESRNGVDGIFSHISASHPQMLEAVSVRGRLNECHPRSTSSHQETDLEASDRILSNVCRFSTSSPDLFDEEIVDAVDNVEGQINVSNPDLEDRMGEPSTGHLGNPSLEKQSFLRFECPMCREKTLPTLEELEEHMSSSHPELDNTGPIPWSASSTNISTYQCPMCLEILASEEGMFFARDV